jgi:hypothetical protein
MQGARSLACLARGGGTAFPQTTPYAGNEVARRRADATSSLTWRDLMRACEPSYLQADPLGGL